MKICIGIDPGNIQSALAVYDGEKLLSFGTYPNDEFFERVKIEVSRSGGIEWAEFGRLGSTREDLYPNVKIFMETIQSYGMPVGQEVFDTCFFIGRLMEKFEDRGFPYEMVKRTEIKLHHCKSTRAKDTNIKAALVERFGDKGTKAAPGFFYGVKGDEWSACAIAVYGHDKLNGRI